VFSIDAVLSLEPTKIVVF